MSSKGIALVTGSAQGIGRGIALRLAADGFDVGINDVSSKKALLDTLKNEIIQKGKRSEIFFADVSSDDEVRDMIEGVVTTLGGLDVMVANAGICPTVPFLDVNIKDWDLAFSINARGTFLCYQYAAKQMVKQGRGGRIIGACSVSGKQGLPMMASYSSTKFAIRGLTQSAALELGKYGITVNAYAPGTIETPMVQAYADKMGIDVSLLHKQAAQQSALGYNGKPDDIANLVSFLASKESNFITGQSVTIDGGRVFD